MLTVTNEFTELIKNFVQRVRPCNDTEIKHLIRIVKAAIPLVIFRVMPQILWHL